VFLGSARAAIPAVTVPVCVIASFIALHAFGFSINLLTLLALVLCIGLVDDAIVVESIRRRVDLDEPPLAQPGRAAQVAFAVIATTAVLVAVFTGRFPRTLPGACSAAVGGAGGGGGDLRLLARH
jgi:multidrug efflux pump